VLRTVRNGAILASLVVLSSWAGGSVPASADTPADVVTVSGSTLLAQACCSKTQFGFVDNDITISGSGTLTVSDTAGVTAGAGCVQVDATHVSCDASAVTLVRVSGANGFDVVHMNADLPSVLNGGPGFDELYGGPANDVLRGGSRPDVLDGGPDADLMIGGNGTDPTVVTTNDPETVSYASRTTPVHVTNDGVANDGAVGEHDIYDPCAQRNDRLRQLWNRAGHGHARQALARSGHCLRSGLPALGRGHCGLSPRGRGSVGARP
jgi:hypothetical protein